MNVHRFWLVILAILLSTGNLALPVAAQPSSKEERKESLAYLAKEAGSYRIRLAENRAAEFTERPLIRWTKVVSEVDDAALFVWMSDGRPVLAATMLVQSGRGLFHEFQSLALEPLQAERDGKTVWNPTQAGLTFARIPESMVPADTTNQRLTQMKSLAERFRAEAIKGPPAYAEGSVYQLRLLPRPLLRYRDPKRPEFEGAIFTFCQDTDPEVLLLVENRVRDGEPGWEFALAPMTGWPVKGFYNQRQVWSVGRHHPAADPEWHYFVAGPFPITAK